MKKMSLVGLVAALAIPAGVVVSESVANAAPAPADRVTAYAKDIINHARVLYNEGLAIGVYSRDNSRLAWAEHVRAVQIRNQAHLVALDAVHQLRDENLVRAELACWDAHRDHAVWHEFEVAAGRHHELAVHYENLAKQDRAEAQRIENHIKLENDPAVKALMQKSADAMKAAAAKDDADAAKQHTEEAKARSEADKLKAAGEAKAREANGLDRAMNCKFQ